MSDHFQSSKYSIARAKQHISDLKRQTDEFFRSNPYGRVVEIDPKTIEQVHKLKLTKPMPVALQGIAADAVTNLRNALDQCIFALMPRKNSYFPIAPDEIHFENTVKGRCKHLPNEIVDLIRTFKPYKGGNDMLWALNELSNTNKHAFISPIAMVSGAFRLEIKSFDGYGTPTQQFIWDRAKNEMELARIRPGSAFNVNLNIAFNIVICNVEFVDGKPANDVLNEFVSIVDSVVMAIEAEAHRLGLP